MRYLEDTDELLAFERQKKAEGFFVIGGVDEVGRGPLAGPVVAAAVAFPSGVPVPAVNDSKQLTAARRDELYELLLAMPGIRYGIAELDPAEIDRINILQASRQAMRLAVRQIMPIDFLLVDGLPVPGFDIPALALVKGDARSASIAAASIIAKVYRDRRMDELAVVYPEYGFEQHKGYGTALHLEALRRHGPCPQHRRSFAPVRDIIDPPPEQLDLF